MGTLYQFTCAACGYTTEASGGSDRGIREAVQTVSCQDCREIFDATLGRADSRRGRTEPKCERNPSHRVVPWTHGGPCPVCNATMPPGVEYALWD
jgi:hypothetical protein